MKIAYVYDAVYPWVKGGAEKRVFEIGRRLVERGHEVHWFGLKWWDGPKDISRDGVYLHGVGEWGELYTDGRRSIKEGLYFGWKVLRGLKGDFDVVDCQEFPYFPCFSSKLRSKFSDSKFFITWHEVWGDYWFKYLGKKGLFGWSVEKLTSKLTDNNIAVSESTRRDLEEMGVKSEVIPNGIDFEWIQGVEEGEKSDLVFAGRLIKEKNVNLLLKSIGLLKEEVPDVRCVVVGDGPERERLERLVKELGLRDNVVFTGFLEDYRDVISYLKGSKVFVLPSVREGFGIVALEANACGLPVVTVDHRDNAAHDLITNENGFICELNERDIADKVREGLKSEGRMRESCVEFAKGYDWGKVSEWVEDSYKRC